MALFEVNANICNGTKSIEIKRTILTIFCDPVISIFIFNYMLFTSVINKVIDKTKIILKYDINTNNIL